jgi:outer membrane protein
MKKMMIAAALFFIGQQARAQAKQELNSLIQQSFNYFPRIKELNKSAELSELRIDAAQSNYLPNVSGIASYTYVNPVSQKAFPTGPNETQLLRFQPYNNYNFNVGLSQVIWDFGKTRAQIEKAKADLLMSQQNTEAAKLQLAAQVASVYYSMIYLKRAVSLQDSVISFYQENKKLVEGKIKQGDALQIDLSTIENNIDQERNRKIEFQRLLARQLAMMRYAIGQSFEPTGTQFELQNKTGTADLSNNPELLAATERISAARADAKFAERNRLPSLSLQAGAGFRNGYQPNIGDIRFNYVGGVTLSVPMFQGGRIRQNIAIAHKTAELNELSKSTLSSTLQKDVESVQSDLDAYQEQIKNSEGQMTVSREALRLTQVRYRQGVVTYLDLVNASTNLQRAYLNKLQYEYQSTLSQVELHRLLGVKFWQD